MCGVENYDSFGEVTRALPSGSIARNKWRWTTEAVQGDHSKGTPGWSYRLYICYGDITIRSNNGFKGYITSLSKLLVVGELSGVLMGLFGEFGPKSAGDLVFEVGGGWDEKGWMLRMILSSTPWSSSDSGNLGESSSDNLSRRGEEEELGELDGWAIMTLS